MDRPMQHSPLLQLWWIHNIEPTSSIALSSSAVKTLITM
jgi:hypothetical protein